MSRSSKWRRTPLGRDTRPPAVTIRRIPESRRCLPGDRKPVAKGFAAVAFWQSIRSVASAGRRRRPTAKHRRNPSAVLISLFSRGVGWVGDRASCVRRAAPRARSSPSRRRPCSTASSIPPPSRDVYASRWKYANFEAGRCFPTVLLSLAAHDHRPSLYPGVL